MKNHHGREVWFRRFFLGYIPCSATGLAITILVPIAVIAASIAANWFDVRGSHFISACVYIAIPITVIYFLILAARHSDK